MSSYKIMRAADAPDYTGDAPGAFFGYARPLESTQLAFNVRELEPGQAHVPPGVDEAWGHSHVTIEELYFVIEGEITVKAGDDMVTLGPRDAILIPAGTPRAARNETGAPAAFAMLSIRVEDQLAESKPHEGFWPR